MSNKKDNIDEVKRVVGWAYNDLNWLTEDEARKRNAERDELLKSLEAYYCFRRSKICYGKLSPGCLKCGEGKWSCLYINVLCTGTCFFCPQDRNVKDERPPAAENILFDNPDDYLDYLERFSFEGVGFSGGETTLVSDKLILYINKIKQRFGNGIYTWVYTNGDLIDNAKLKGLKAAGLDEIRFNISARDYSLNKVKSATEFIDTVTVEIPAIPEDHEILKKQIGEMQRSGVHHLNLHQLFTTPHNYKAYIDRSYTFLHRPDLPILESEMSALNLLRYAMDSGVTLPINYCSCAYKQRFQQMGRRLRAASAIRRDFDGITSLGYIRLLSVVDSPENINDIAAALAKSGHDNNLWSLDDTGTELSVHRSLLKHIDAERYSVDLSYILADIKGGRTPHGYEIKLNTSKSVFVESELICALRGLKPASVMRILQCFERERVDKVRGSAESQDSDIFREIMPYEVIESGFPEIY